MTDDQKAPPWVENAFRAEIPKEWPRRHVIRIDVCEFATAPDGSAMDCGWDSMLLEPEFSDKDEAKAFAESLIPPDPQ